MRFSVLSQLYQAIAALALGMSCAVFYDILRIIRIRCVSSLVTVICDFIFSLIFCCGLFLLGFSIGSGQQRVFMTVFSALSAALYFCLFSKCVRKILTYFFAFAGKILHIAALPAVFVLKLFKNFIFFSKNLFHYIKKWYTIKDTSKYLRTQIKRSRLIGPDGKGR